MSDSNPDSTYPVERVTLWKGGGSTFGITVPQNALLVESKNVAEPYLEWRHSKVQVFLRGPSAVRFIGKRVFVTGNLCEKRWSDGRKGLYIDLENPRDPPANTYPSHDFAVHSSESEMKSRPPVYRAEVEGSNIFVCVYEYAIRPKKKAD